MKTTIRLLRIFGIPIEINLSWLLTLAFVTASLALRFYPEVLPDGYRGDYLLHWAMGLGSGIFFFASVLAHELAHSLVARRQGIEVKSITLFLFGGVSQIAGDARRPLNEFFIAIVGPLMSLLLAGFFFASWFLTGQSDNQPAALVLQWLFIMNLVVAVFNMAPGFPMDGGRVLRSIIWGLSGSMFRATQIATVIGRAMGYGMMLVGALAFLGFLKGYLDPFDGLWFVLLGMFLESSSKQSWFQARALHTLSSYKASDIMSKNLLTAYSSDFVRYLRQRAGRFFIYFVVDEVDDHVMGVVTEKEVDLAEKVSPQLDQTAGQLMVATESLPTIELEEDGANILQRMEAGTLWHMPVIEDGRVVGVVSKDSLLRLLAQKMYRLPQPSSSV